MSGAHDINELLSGMSPSLDEGDDYLFLTVRQEVLRDCDTVVMEYLRSISISVAAGVFREEEGLTVILPESYLVACVANPEESTIPSSILAEWMPILGEASSLRMRRITMKIHSSLTAVGFTAAFSKALTEAGISCNVVAGYYHDHIFVPSAKASDAMGVLTALSSSSA